MKKESVNKFELNTQALENFDKIMSTKLDEIEELKITGLDKGSKLLNIISLCANIKTLIIEGDHRINVDKILSNIFKPKKLENIIFNNVKIPKADSLKRFTNLKMISLNDIRFCDAKELFKGISKPEKLEIITISNTDMLNKSIIEFEKFLNIKYIKLDNAKNFKLDNLAFLESYKQLLKIDITNMGIPIDQINVLLQLNCSKNIDLNIIDEKNNVIKDCELTNLTNSIKLILTPEKLEYIANKVDLNQIETVKVIINNDIENYEFIEKLKEFDEKEIEIVANNFSLVNVEFAQKLKNDLKIKKIKFLDGNTEKEYKISKYIDKRIDLDCIVDNVSKHVNEVEKFLEIYKVLGEQFKIDEKCKEVDLKNKICPKIKVATILQNCLQNVDIKSNIIKGQDIENEEKHSWNQVLLDGKWYNVDLALDIENIPKKKTEYCLLGDKTFFETHIPKSGKNNYCPEDFSEKYIKVFFKTGLFKDKLWKSYIELILEKIKKILKLNKKEEKLALPEGDIDDEKADE